MMPIAPHMEAFLRERLPVERGASINTCDSYVLMKGKKSHFENETAGAVVYLRHEPSSVEICPVTRSCVASSTARRTYTHRARAKRPTESRER